KTIAYLANFAKVAGHRRNGSGCSAHHGFSNKGTDGVGPQGQNQLLKLACQACAVLFVRLAGKAIVARKTRRNMMPLHQQGLIKRTTAYMPTNGQRPQRIAVITELARNSMPAAGLAPLYMILTRHFQCSFNGL